MENIEKIMKKNEVFSNFWQADSYKNTFFNVDVCQEVTDRIKKDPNYVDCLKIYPNGSLGKLANISVDVDDGIPYILRTANWIGKVEYEIIGSKYILPLFTTKELSILSKIASEVRKRNKQYKIQNQKGVI